MRIGQKLLAGAVLLSIVPLAITSALLWQGTNTLSATTVDNLVQTQLTALRDEKVALIQEEFDSRIKDLRAIASNRSTAEAMVKFKATFATAARDANSAAAAPAHRQAMMEFVSTQFVPRFASRNPGKAPDLTAQIDGRDANAVLLQNDYIVANPNKLGEKDKLEAAPGNLPYHAVHAAYHPSLHALQKLHEFYDVFLIDTSTDQIVYSVFKELDFGTRLTDGIAAKSKLAEAYLRVKNAKSPEEVFLTDFQPYLASYDDNAAFAAMPIFEGDRQVGVLAVQYPIDKITSAINSNKSWQKVGLGATGDAYLFGNDKLLRTDVRDVLTDKAKFVENMGSRLSGETKVLVEKKGSTVGAVTVDTEAEREALAGKSGVLRFEDYRGVPMIGAFAPLQMHGLSWGIVVGISQAEADAPLKALSDSTLTRAGLVATGALIVVGGLMGFVLRTFMKPITKLHETVAAVAQGQTDARSNLTEADELGELGRAFDKMLDERIAALEMAAKENERLNNSVISLLQTVFQLGNKDLTVRAEVTEDVIGTLSSSINQVSQATGNALSEVRSIAEHVKQASEMAAKQAGRVDETAQGERQALQQMSSSLSRAVGDLVQMAQLSENSNQAAEKASSATDGALRAVSATVRGMDELRDSISETEKRFKRLGERSQEISSVVSLINTISERTHMLAMNASMQAATAGEAGRGFAVVAEEVQRLSESSRQATQQIGQLVHNIQVETNETLYTMNRLISQVVSQSEQAQQAGEQMTLTQSTTRQLVDLVQQISKFSSEQSALARELQVSVEKLNHGSQQTVSAISEQTRSTTTLVGYSRRLAETVSQFKLPDTQDAKTEMASLAAPELAEAH